MADRWASSQEDPDQPHHQDKNGGREKVSRNSTRGTQGGNQVSTPKKKGFQGFKKEETGRKKFQGNCFVCGKPGHHAQNCYQKVVGGKQKGKSSDNVAKTCPN